MMEGVANARGDIDTSMRFGAGHPMGPLALADMIGLDICLKIMETLYREFKRSQISPPARCWSNMYAPANSAARLVRDSSNTRIRILSGEYHGANPIGLAPL